MTVLSAICFVLMGFALGVLVGRKGLSWKKPQVAQLIEKPKKENTYGHPRPPLSRLRKQLPAPPAGFIWETKVENNKAGEPELHLTMLNAATEETPEGGVCVNLYRGGLYGTWAAWYRKWPDAQVEKLDNEVLGSLVDWATKITYKYNTPEEYGIG